MTSWDDVEKLAYWVINKKFGGTWNATNFKTVVGEGCEQ